jgi:hypothetical protein
MGRLYNCISRPDRITQHATLLTIFSSPMLRMVSCTAQWCASPEGAHCKRMGEPLASSSGEYYDTMFIHTA